MRQGTRAGCREPARAGSITGDGTFGLFQMPITSRLTHLINLNHQDGVELHLSRPGKPTGNAFIEAFNG